MYKWPYAADFHSFRCIHPGVQCPQYRADVRCSSPEIAIKDCGDRLHAPWTRRTGHIKNAPISHGVAFETSAGRRYWTRGLRISRPGGRISLSRTPISTHVPKTHPPASPKTISAAFSPIIMQGAFVFPDVRVGMIDASATRSPWIPRTRNPASTTAIGSDPILHVPTG